MRLFIYVAIIASQVPGGVSSYSMNMSTTRSLFALHGVARGLMLMLVTSDAVHDIV